MLSKHNILSQKHLYIIYSNTMEGGEGEGCGGGMGILGMEVGGKETIRHLSHLGTCFSVV